MINCAIIRKKTKEKYLRFTSCFEPLVLLNELIKFTSFKVNTLRKHSFQHSACISNLNTNYM